MQRAAEFLHECVSATVYLFAAYYYHTRLLQDSRLSSLKLLMLVTGWH